MGRAKGCVDANDLYAARMNFTVSKRPFFIFYTLFAAFLSSVFASEASAQKYSRHELIKYISKETGLPKNYVTKYIMAAKFDAGLIKKMNTPYESKTYGEYRPLFVTAGLQKKAEAYMEKHRDIFKRAQEKYGVAPEMIAAILGIETRFGENWGRDRVLDALVTLSTGYERRGTFFRNELRAFLQLCKEEGLNPLEIEGSYAGAFGVTQLMPSSFLEYAVDGNNDGKRDVWATPEDIIFSVAYYFSRYHWSDDKMVARWLDTLPNHAAIAEAVKDETRKWRKLEVLEAGGLKKPNAGWKSDEEVAIISRETVDGERYLLINRNFHAITRWNRSWNYALAATELASMLGNEKCAVD